MRDDDLSTLTYIVAQDLMDLNPDHDIIPVEGTIVIQEGKLSEMVWPEDWEFNGTDKIYNADTDTEITIAAYGG